MQYFLFVIWQGFFMASSLASHSST